MDDEGEGHARGAPPSAAPGRATPAALRITVRVAHPCLNLVKCDSWGSCGAVPGPGRCRGGPRARADLRRHWGDLTLDGPSPRWSCSPAPFGASGAGRASRRRDRRPLRSGPSPSPNPRPRPRPNRSPRPRAVAHPEPLVVARPTRRAASPPADDTDADLRTHAGAARPGPVLSPRPPSTRALAASCLPAARHAPRLPASTSRCSRARCVGSAAGVLAEPTGGLRGRESFSWH